MVEHYHPAWMDPLRHVVGPPTQASLPGTGTNATTATTHPAPKHRTSGKMLETSSRTSGGRTYVTYSVPGPSYVLAITTTQACSVQVNFVKGNVELFTSTLPAGVTKRVVVPRGSTALIAYASGSSLVVDSHGKKVGAVPALEYAVIYTFNPSS